MDATEVHPPAVRPPAARQQTSRPRVTGERESEIFNGAIEILERVGYDKFTFDLVAAEVKASKATLYRRWPSKADLIFDALDALTGCPDAIQVAPDSGDLRTDLYLFTEGKDEFSQRYPSVFGAVYSAMQRDEALHQKFHQEFIGPRQQILCQIFIQAQGRNEIGPDANIELLASLFPALVTYRVAQTGEGPSIEYLTQIIDNILLPSCYATTSTAKTATESE